MCEIFPHFGNYKCDDNYVNNTFAVFKIMKIIFVYNLNKNEELLPRNRMH